MSLFIHEDETCPECNAPAAMSHDTSTREVWFDCETPNCVYGKDADATLESMGYLDDEKESVLDAVLGNRPPYHAHDLAERVKWVEFLRAMKEQDFTPGDEFGLNGIHFLVM